MRAVFDALDRMGIRYCVTGSVAASVYGVLRQSQDTDVLIELDSDAFVLLAERLQGEFAIADPIDYGAFALASVIDKRTADKVDLILQRPTAFESEAFERRRRADVPGLGSVWVVSIEDLVLAKLVWSEGSSELQLRDCSQLLRVNADSVDSTYLEQWANRLGVAQRLRDVS